MTDTIKQKIIEALALQGLSEEKQEEIILSLGSLIMQKVFVEIMNALSDEDVISFEKVLSTGSNEETNAFLMEKVPNIDEMVATVSKETVDEYKKSE